MAEYPIYRLVKGDQLTFTEMDNNLRWLSQNMSGSQLTLTGSTIGVTGSMIIDGDVFINGTASIGFLKTIAFSSGSNQLGDDITDRQTLIGTVNISGSLTVTGSANIPDLTGSLFGTASWALNSVTASFAINAISASYVSGSAAIITNLTSSNDARINGANIGTKSTTSIIFGTFSGNSVTTAGNGVYIGYNAGPAITTGNGNTLVGFYAGRVLNTGYFNTIIGVSAGYDITSGYYNTFIGKQAGYGITTGNNNIVISSRVTGGTGITTGSYNTIIGDEVGGLSSTLSNNIILSDGQGNIKYRWDATQNNIYGNLAVTGSITATQNITASNALITGTITAQTLVVQTITSSVIYSSGSNVFGNQLTNTQVFTGSVRITGSLNVKNIPQGSYGNIVVVDTASGDFYLTASNSVGSPAVLAYIGQDNLYSLTPKASVPGVAAINSIFIGSGSGAGINDNDSVNSVIIGFEAGGGTSNSDAKDSTWIGYQAGYNSEYAERSIFIGYQAGALDGLGGPELNDSIFLGYQAGYSSSFAYDSNFLGYHAGYSASDARNSNFMGTNAGYAAKDANDSNFLGSSAGFDAHSAQYSNFLGNNSGYQSYNADHSNFLGQEAGGYAPSASYSNLFGYRAGHNATIFGGIGSNNIVIGTNITLQDGRRDSINIGGILFGTGSYSDAGSFIPSPDAVLDGRIGINKSVPTYNLDVSGSGNFTKGLDVTGSLKVSTTTGVFLPPRMTAAQRVALGTPTVGSMVYQTDATEGVYVYTSTGWRSLAMI